MFVPTILLVDDSPLLLKLARLMLKSLEATIKTAANGLEAWEIMNRSPADVVVTDLIMPEMTGFELIEKLRSDPRFQQTYILVMTSLGQTADKVRALSSGANDYVVKPLDEQEFRVRVAGGVREITLKHELTRTLAMLDDELRAVAKIQKKLLPADLPVDERVACAVSYQPWSRSGGDYYNAGYDDRRRLVVTMADVSGHGAGAAVLMAMFRVIFDQALALNLPAGAFMEALNKALVRQIGREPAFITACLAILAPDGRSIDFCSAGHGDQYLIGPGRGDLRRLSSGGPVLGFFDCQWASQSVPVRPGQSLVMFTDGLIEARNGENEEFGQERLETVLRAADPEAQPELLVKALLTTVHEFSGPVEFSDDVTILVTRFL